MQGQNMERKNLAKHIYKTNLFLLKGSKENTEIFFRKTCSSIKNQKKESPISTMIEAIEIIKPFCEAKSVKMRNNITKVPVEITKKRQQLLATRFLLTAVREKKSNFLHQKLSDEINGILSFTSNSLKICESFQKNVETNKIFIQYKF